MLLVAYWKTGWENSKTTVNVSNFINFQKSGISWCNGRLIGCLSQRSRVQDRFSTSNILEAMRHKMVVKWNFKFLERVLYRAIYIARVFRDFQKNSLLVFKIVQPV
jgi:hypothetical protein